MNKIAQILIVLYCLAQVQSNLPGGLGEVNRLLVGGASDNTVAAGGSCIEDCGWNQVVVNGVGKLNVNPDVVSVSVQVNANGLTTNDALNSLSQKINTIFKALSSNGLNSSNWATNYLSVYANTSYINGTTVTYGQIASESLTIKIPLKSADGTIIAKIYDGIAVIDDVDIYGLSFDLKDKTSAFAAARKLAYQDAVNRATDYTLAAGVKLGTALAVTDSYYSTYFSPSTSGSGAGSSSSTVSIGKIVVNYNVGATFAFS